MTPQQSQTNMTTQDVDLRYRGSWVTYSSLHAPVLSFFISNSHTHTLRHQRLHHPGGHKVVLFILPVEPSQANCGWMAIVWVVEL